MKKLLVLSITLIGLLSKASSLYCVSYDIVNGWDSSATHEKVILTAKVLANSELNNVTINGAYKSDTRDLSIDPTYKPKNPKYYSMNRYHVLEDAWHWFSPLLPKNLSLTPLNKKFTGYIQVYGEQGWVNNIAVSCQLSY
ncbi:MAG: hypothetical protein KDD45_10375 [Bdellovibrionales bacterium]|nr:hypothetical protein [Bdellovibrionales bacterium]